MIIKRHFKNKYNIHHDYFSKESHIMMYIVGFITADGCIIERNDCQDRLTINIIDKVLLEKIRDEIAPLKSIYERKKNRK